VIEKVRKGEVSIDRIYQRLAKKRVVFQKGIDDIESVGTKGIIPLRHCNKITY
jgi:hypothetical protein